MNRQVVITGVGLISPLGNSMESFWASLRRRECGAREPQAGTSLIGKGRKVVGLVEDDGVMQKLGPETIDKLDVTSQRVLAACRQALRDAGIDDADKQERRFFCSLGSAMGNLPPAERLEITSLTGGVPDIYPSRIVEFRNQAIVDNLCRSENLACPGVCIASNCSAGLHAVGHGFNMVKQGRTDVAIVGGFEVFRPFLFSILSDMGFLSRGECRPFDRDNDGMFVGEGAGFLVLEDLETAEHTGKRIYAEVCGYGQGFDAYHPFRFSPVGKGIVTAMETALKSACLDVRELDLVVADAKGIKDGDRSEAYGLKRALGTCSDTIPVTSLKAQVTHTMGASGPFSVIAGLKCLAENVIPHTVGFRVPDRNVELNVIKDRFEEREVNVILVNAIGAGGNAASIAIRKR